MMLLSALLLAAQAPSASLFLEREILLRADARCGLLSDAAQTSLRAGAHQAGWAARREGVAAVELAALKTEAQTRADSLACTAPVLRTSAAQAEAAFAGWTRQWTQRFPGATAEWLARRVADPSGFLLVQSSGVWTLGVRLDPSGATAALALRAPPGDWRQATLRLRAAASAPPPPSVSGRVAPPPRQAADAYLARGRAQEQGGVVFTFERAAVEHLRVLAPHDGAVATLIARDGAVVEHLFEVGDFGLGLALVEGQGRTVR